MGIPKVKKMIKKIRKLNEKGEFNIKFLQPIAYFYTMVQTYKFFQFKELMQNDIAILKDQKQKMTNLNNVFEKDNIELREAVNAQKSNNNKIQVIRRTIKESLERKIKAVYELKF